MQNSSYCVIMAGGVGSRFWPYSRNHRPKQFLDFFGTGRSLLQMTIDRLRPLVPIENMLVVTNAQYRDLVRDQIADLPQENILLEPCRRNTAPCIAFAMKHIAAKTKTKEANVLIAASDHLITAETDFRETIARGLDFVKNNDVLLTLGMQPTRPETGYGYIQTDVQQLAEGIFKVKTFTEKPHLEKAKHFLESGDFLWNSGMFIWNLQTILTALREYLPEVMSVLDNDNGRIGSTEETDFINEHFSQCPSVSIDYGVMEKADNVAVMASDFGWSDVGTWGSLYELSEKDTHGNVSLHSETMFYDANNNIVTLEKGKLAVIEGLEDYIVAESEGVLLICKKEHEQQIREMVADAEKRFEGKYN